MGVTPAQAYLDTCVALDLIAGAAGQEAIRREAFLPLLESAQCISDLVRMECLVRPLRSGDAERLGHVKTALSGFRLLTLPPDVFDLAAGLRARHGLKTADALHLGCAMYHRCDQFWTNDKRLAKAVPGWMALKVLRPAAP